MGAQSSQWGFVPQLNGWTSETIPLEPVSPLPERTTEEIIVGWRAWEVRKVGRIALLESLTQKLLWPVGERAVASHKPSDPGDGSDSSIFGIYAYTPERRREIAEILKYYAPGCSCHVGKSFVWGKVSLWGEVIAHESGYRAEFAYPRKLYGPNAEVLETLGSLYGCETELAEAPPA
jgi:hypothetical protein